MSDLCPVCQRAEIRREHIAGGRATAQKCERQSQVKLTAAFKQAMSTYRNAEGWIPEWAAVHVLQAFRKVFYLRGYTAGYKAGLAKVSALQVPRRTEVA